PGDPVPLRGLLLGPLIPPPAIGTPPPENQQGVEEKEAWKEPDRELRRMREDAGKAVPNAVGLRPKLRDPASGELCFHVLDASGLSCLEKLLLQLLEPLHPICGLLQVSFDVLHGPERILDRLRPR